MIKAFFVFRAEVRQNGTNYIVIKYVKGCKAIKCCLENNVLEYKILGRKTQPLYGGSFMSKYLKNRVSSASSKSEVRRPGRPPKFTGQLLRTIVKAVKANGGNLSHTQLALKKDRIKISLPTISKLARRNGLAVLSIGRPVISEFAA